MHNQAQMLLIINSMAIDNMNFHFPYAFSWLKMMFLCVLNRLSCTVNNSLSHAGEGLESIFTTFFKIKIH